jgi:hypothetical protein
MDQHEEKAKLPLELCIACGRRGVEAGQFLFISCVLALTAVMLWAVSKRTPIDQQRSATLQFVPPYVIGTVAMFWVVQRIAAF